MKKYNTILLIATFIIVGCGNSIVKSYKTANTDVLYVGVEHFIEFEFASDKNINIETDKGTIKKIENSTYSIYPDTMAGILTLTITNNRKSEKIKFRIKEIPNLKANAGIDKANNNSSTFTSDQFKTFSLLRVDLINFDFNCSIEINRYQITRISRDGNTETAIIDNPRKGPNMANFLVNKAQPGDVYLFEDIYVTVSPGADNKRSYTRKIDNAIYYIKKQ